MIFPINEIIKFNGNKYEIATAMILYAKRLEEYPELLLEVDPKSKEMRLKIILDGLLNQKIKYSNPKSESE